LVFESFLKYEIFGLLGVILLIVFYKLLTGKINTDKMLLDKTKGTISGSRVQQLFFTVFIALYYVYLCYKDPSKFPEIPQELLYLMGGSSTLYLSDKLRTVLKLINKKTG